MVIFIGQNTLDPIQHAHHPADASGGSHKHLKRYAILLFFKKRLKTK